MGTVIVEGKVFAVEHKELTKNSAFVIGFDMTDHTSSVHISRYLKNAEAKPITEGVHEGDVVKVQGKLQIDNYSGETVLKPWAAPRNQVALGPDSARPETRPEVQ
jgi:DNA polymerase-3 subunit alpha (Gram-positive type)